LIKKEQDMPSKNHWISRLQLISHPEGGYYREVYRSVDSVRGKALPKRFGGKRNLATGIYFLLTQENFSSFHRLKADELWHHYDGATVVLHVIAPDGAYSRIQVGRNLDSGDSLQAYVPANHWFAGEVSAEDGYALAGCTMSPGFDFEDFELGKKDKLTAVYPQHSLLIERFTRQ
jgi:predicted cupin superfamily sugar epimerase